MSERKWMGAAQFGALGPPAELWRKFSGRSMVGIKARIWGSKAWISPESSPGALRAEEGRKANLELSRVRA